MTIITDCVIIGAGPSGLFQVFELGLLGIDAHIVDSLSQVGGQCSELYPDKPIYDIPALPVVSGQELIDRLMTQIEPFKASFHLQQELTGLRKRSDGRFDLVTSLGTKFNTATVVVAGGLGSFRPRTLRKPGVEKYNHISINYKAINPEHYRGKNITILGGGDSALDWTMELSKVAQRVTLIHRRKEFRGSPAISAQVRQLAADGVIDIYLGQIKGIIENKEKSLLTGLQVKTFEGDMVDILNHEILVFYGLAPKLGPIADWGLNIDKNKIIVNPADFSSNCKGIFAIGDINEYPGKRPLIVCSFHEAVLAAYGVQKHLQPDVRQFVQYTTSSPLLHKRLGLDSPAAEG